MLLFRYDNDCQLLMRNCGRHGVSVALSCSQMN